MLGGAFRIIFRITQRIVLMFVHFPKSISQSQIAISTKIFFYFLLMRSPFRSQYSEERIVHPHSQYILPANISHHEFEYYRHDPPRVASAMRHCHCPVAANFHLYAVMKLIISTSSKSSSSQSATMCYIYETRALFHHIHKN